MTVDRGFEAVLDLETTVAVIFRFNTCQKRYGTITSAAFAKAAMARIHASAE
jgi:hypothetical protein